MSKSLAMAEIAEALGCHQTTVSRALRNDPRISEETRARVRDMCQKMGYRPNPLVSALIASRRRKSGSSFQANLAYITRNPYPGPIRPNTYMAEIFTAARNSAAEKGYHLDEVRVEETNGTALAMQRLLRARGICGAIIGSMPPRSSPFHFPWEQLPLVAIGYGLVQPELYRVATNNYESTYRGMEECRRLGYRRVGFIIAEDENTRSRGHEIGGYMAYQMSLKESERIPLLIAYSHETERITKWLKKNRPDAILTAQAKEILGLCQKVGLKCPDDIGIVGLGNEHDDFFARMERSFDRIGALAADLLIRRVERDETGLPVHAGQYLVMPKWREGVSVRQQ